MDDQQQNEEDTANTKMKIVMFPWLAMGHLIPFLLLSQLLAQKGNQIYFLSTPKNLSRLIPKIPSRLTSKIALISLPLPCVPNLPHRAESSADVPYNDQQLLKKAFDLLEQPLADFLESTKPDWVFYDYASHWVPSLTAKLRIPCAFFSVFTAATLSFVGPPSLLIKGVDYRSKAEDFTVLPKWVPFQSDVVYRSYEVTKYVDKTREDISGPTDTVRFGFSAGGSDVVVVRSSPEVEPEWFRLLNQLYGKPIVPVGFLPPVVDDNEEESQDGGDGWGGIKRWLNSQKINSVVYVAVGTEVALTREEVRELALGLEKSMLPFFWVLRNPQVLELLPEGFEERVNGRRYIYTGWAPQVKILSHSSVGGFVTHCGWNSIIEGLAFGRVLVLLPFINDQGLNARLLHGKKLGVEVPRDEQDGSFTSEWVAKSVRLAMIDNPGEPWRSSAKETRSVFGDEGRNQGFVDSLVEYLEENRRMPSPRSPPSVA